MSSFPEAGDALFPVVIFGVEMAAERFGRYADEGGDVAAADALHDVGDMLLQLFQPLPRRHGHQRQVFLQMVVGKVFGEGSHIPLPVNVAFKEIIVLLDVDAVYQAVFQRDDRKGRRLTQARRDITAHQFAVKHQFDDALVVLVVRAYAFYRAAAYQIQRV